MKNTDTKEQLEEFKEKPLFVIDDKPEREEHQRPDKGEVFYRKAAEYEREIPRMMIENSDSDSPSFWGCILKLLLICFTIFLIIAGLIVLARDNEPESSIEELDVPVSVTEKKNIEKLTMPTPTIVPEVIFSQDSVLGVALDFYAIKGLKAQLSFIEPDTADCQIYLYSYSADFSSFNPEDNYYLGDLVVGGKEYPSATKRYGYCAMVDNQVVIGVDNTDEIKDYVIEHGGSLFRQFVLVSNGVLPRSFRLHGKVERRALGRIGDQLYYVATRHKETMWDFADALREYGFVDAIYITGGDYYTFYRTADRTAHFIGDATRANELGDNTFVPWLIFRTIE